MVILQRNGLKGSCNEEKFRVIELVYRDPQTQCKGFLLTMVGEAYIC